MGSNISLQILLPEEGAKCQSVWITSSGPPCCVPFGLYHLGSGWEASFFKAILLVGCHYLPRLTTSNAGWNLENLAKVIHWSGFQTQGVLLTGQRFKDEELPAWRLGREAGVSEEWGSALGHVLHSATFGVWGGRVRQKEERHPPPHCTLLAWKGAGKKKASGRAALLFLMTRKEGKRDGTYMNQTESTAESLPLSGYLQALSDLIRAEK